jgi:transposase
MGLGGDRNHGGADMAQVRTWAAFDVHVSGVLAATLERDSGELRVQRLAGGSDAVVEFVDGLPGPVRATYEAGPTGFVLARRLEAVGVDCLVCAPGLISRGPSDRVKTDRRDAERLVRLLAAGELHRVTVPSVEEEALRDLVRAREDLRGDLMRARHRTPAAACRRAAPSRLRPCSRGPRRVPGRSAITRTDCGDALP